MPEKIADIVQGVVTKSTGSWYKIHLDNGEMIAARLKGKYRLKQGRNTNPVSVGDVVHIKRTGPDEWIIDEVEPRHNYLIRKSTKLSKETHIIASNIDQVVIVASVAQPRTPLGFIDRILATAEAYSIPSILIFNKIDVARAKDLLKLEKAERIYTDLNYPNIRTSSVTREGTEAFREMLRGKTSLLTGQSGVGKSTLINCIEPELDLKTAEVSDYNEKGKHTTTFAEMFFTSFDARLIDTPGLRSFGMIDIDKEHLAHHFREMEKYLGHCKFNNCVHINEPGCAVKDALERGEIAPSRYDNYLIMYMDEVENEGK